MSDQSSWAQKTQRVQLGIRTTSPAVQGPQEAIITQVGTAALSIDGAPATTMDVVWFYLPNTYGTETGFGPAPYEPVVGWSPVAGTRCIVVFAGVGTGRPYVVSFPTATPTSELAVLEAVYPIGSIYMSTAPTSPATLFGFGTWVAFAPGRTIIGVGTSDQPFTAGATGGASTSTGVVTHTHPASGSDSGHGHTFSIHVGNGTTAFDGTAASGNSAVGATGDEFGATIGNGNANISVSTSAPAGAVSSISTLPSYIVTYIWNRTA